MPASGPAAATESARLLASLSINANSTALVPQHQRQSLLDMSKAQASDKGFVAIAPLATPAIPQ